MRHANAVFLMATLVVASAANAGQPVSEAEKSKVRTEIETAVKVMVAGANAVDVERTLASASSSPDFRMADNGTIYGSREATLAAFRPDFASLRSQDIRISEQHVAVPSHDLAVYTSRGTFTSTNKSGKTSPSTPFAWTILWAREGTQWKMLNIHQSFGPAATP